MKKILWSLFLAQLLSLTAAADPRTGEEPGRAAPVWVLEGPQQADRIPLYFFWTPSCPHCTEARPVIEQMARDIDWLQLHSLSLTVAENRQRYRQLAAALGEPAQSVPAFLFCGQMFIGFDPEHTPQQLDAALRQCHAQASVAASADLPLAAAPRPPPQITLPGLGSTDATTLSLPMLTLVLAGLDSFNPCAFFVLLFLLSLLVHANSRRRMLLIGGVYVLVSGLMYFAFMAAWLNLFLWIGDSRVITLAAGLIALLFASLNIKDFFTGAGPSLRIPAQARPGLYQRMRRLINVRNLPAMLTGTIALALLANSYELLCTAGFPMVYTRTLTLHGLSPPAYYLYLALYNLVYVIPLLLITGLFVLTLGSRKLQAHEGRALKLLSGLMMLGLGLILTLAPQWLDHAFTAVMLLLIAVALTALGLKWLRPGPTS